MDNKDDENISPITAEEWISHFRKLFEPHSLTGHKSETDILNELKALENQPTFNDLSFQITTEEVKSAMSKMKSGKSPGTDSISSEIIKACSNSILPLLTKLFNLILVKGQYPKCWTEGVISTIHKKGSPSSPDNYRGITISSCMGKLFGIILNKRLTQYCNDHNIIDERQAGFKKGSRTSDNMFIIRTLHEKYCQRDNKKLYSCFIDFKKAFDSIWHSALFLKLQKLGIGGPFYNIIKDMYKSNTASVKCGQTLSETFRIQKGVKQGDILSPLLFNIFINDLIPLLNDPENDPPSLLTKDVGCLLYADDLVILSTSKEGLQKSLDKLNQYCTKWKLEINVTKSKSLIFSKQGKDTNDLFTIGDQALDQVKSYPYLGIEFSSSGSFKLAQQKLTNKAMKALFKLKQLLYDSNLKPDTSLKLFDQLIKPICLYGAEIWGVDSINISMDLQENGKLENSLEKILCEKLNISFSKYILGVHKNAQNSAVRGELGRLPLGTDVLMTICRYKERLEFAEESSLLSEAYKTSTDPTSKQKWGLLGNRICDYIKKYTPITDEPYLRKKNIKSYLLTCYSKYWEQKIASEAKMRTYVQFKSVFLYEDYLNIKNEKHRKALTRLRISAHTLAIEHGRYTRPIIPPEKRLCTYCPNDKIEDEYHFLLECCNYNTLRSDLENDILNLCKNYQNLTPRNKFLYLLSGGELVANHVGEFVHKAFAKR